MHAFSLLIAMDFNELPETWEALETWSFGVTAAPLEDGDVPTFGCRIPWDERRDKIGIVTLVEVNADWLFTGDVPVESDVLRLRAGWS